VAAPTAAGVVWERAAAWGFIYVLPLSRSLCLRICAADDAGHKRAACIWASSTGWSSGKARTWCRRLDRWCQRCRSPPPGGLPPDGHAFGVAPQLLLRHVRPVPAWARTEALGLSATALPWLECVAARLAVPLVHSATLIWHLFRHKVGVPGAGLEGAASTFEAAFGTGAGRKASDVRPRAATAGCHRGSGRSGHAAAVAEGLALAARGCGVVERSHALAPRLVNVAAVLLICKKKGPPCSGPRLISKQ
jgi:hypothetical protein